MCGIVGGIAQRNVEPILLEGLRRLEYRGYDSAGLAVINGGKIYRKRGLGKVKGLETLLEAEPIPDGPPTASPAQPMRIRIFAEIMWP
jgi:glucosamine--fructose-6-phosphate aminotransferase (isomerizing)